MRHRIQSKKFNRNTKHRKALFKNLLAALVIHKQLTTTEAKAKQIKRLIDKLITQAKKETLNSRRLIHSYFNDKSVTTILVDQMAPQMRHRTSGYTKLARIGYRTGDNSMMARLTFVDPVISVDNQVPSTQSKSKVSNKQDN